MLLGTALVFAALLLLCMNEREADEAGNAAQTLLSGVVDEIEMRSAYLKQEAALSGTRSAPDADGLNTIDTGGEIEGTMSDGLRVDPYDGEMTVVTIDGNDYVGCISIPELELELPVMSEWSYPRLRSAPCRYCGSTRQDDLVILAHNYARHFGRLKELSPGDAVIFTDMNGVVNEYVVVEVDTLSPYAVSEMVSCEYDLTLFTCTYGGRSRVTVRCDRKE